MLYDWTTETANTIKNGGLSTEDANNLLIELAILTEIFSVRFEEERLNLDKLAERLMLYDFVAIKVIGSALITAISGSLTTGASMKEFEEWASGSLGKGLTHAANRILGIDWKIKDEIRDRLNEVYIFP